MRDMLIVTLADSDLALSRRRNETDVNRSSRPARIRDRRRLWRPYIPAAYSHRQVLGKKFRTDEPTEARHKDFRNAHN